MGTGQSEIDIKTVSLVDKLVATYIFLQNMGCRLTVHFAWQIALGYESILKQVYYGGHPFY